MKNESKHIASYNSSKILQSYHNSKDLNESTDSEDETLSNHLMKDLKNERKTTA